MQAKERRAANIAKGKCIINMHTFYRFTMKFSLVFEDHYLEKNIM
jgi:hypothetical protein